MKSACAVWMTLGLICTMSASASPPTAEQILQKCLASFDTAKTYQGVTTIKMQDADQQTVVTVHTKAEKGSDGFIARAAINTTVAATSPTGTTTSTQNTIDDGTMIFTVEPDQKQYSKRPHVPDKISGLFRSSFKQSLDGVRRFGGKWTVSIARFQNRPVYKLLGRFAGSEIQIIIDKPTFRLYSFRGERGQGANRSVMEITVSQQVINQALPETIFTWSPPPEYKETASNPQIIP